MTAEYQQAIAEHIEKLKPAGAILKDCVLDALPFEDPIDRFAKRLEQENIDIIEIRESLVQLMPTLNWPWFFTQVGLPQELSFFAETFRRFEKRLLPPLQRPTEVMWLLEQVFGGRRLQWIEELTPAQLEKLFWLFIAKPFHWPEFFFAHLQLSIEILAQRVSGLGLDALIAKRLLDREDLQRQFLDLGRLSFSEGNKSEKLENLIFLNGLRGCENAIEYIRSRSLTEGTSLFLTFRILQIEELITRLKQILRLMRASSGEDSLSEMGQTFRKILLTEEEHLKVGDFLGRNLEILAYQITLLAERTGEHYIANNAKELRKMWVKAIKGGAIVATLVLFKVLASKLPLAPLLEAVTYGTIYAVGFLVIQTIGGALATKQPAMTAATLAAAMDGAENSESQLKNLMEAVVRTLRTQIAALLGNYLFGFPVAVLLMLPFVYFGFPLMSVDKSNHMIYELHPYFTLSLFYAAVAGVCLFLSGLVSGLADNWFDFNHVGERLETIFTGGRAKRWIDNMRENFGVWSGNIALGYMLGLAPFIGSITGLPINVRHVTFSSASFGAAWMHQPETVLWKHFLVIAGGILVMGMINLTVSFSLSLLVAMKSRRLKLEQGGRLLWLLTKHVLRNPLVLFIDRRRSGGSPAEPYPASEDKRV